LKKLEAGNGYFALDLRFENHDTRIRMTRKKPAAGRQGQGIKDKGQRIKDKVKRKKIK